LVLFVWACVLLSGCRPWFLGPPRDKGLDDEMTTYYVGLIFHGPTWTPDTSPDVKRLQEEHLLNLQKLARDGKLVLAGPVTDSGDLRGLFVFRTESLEEARALTDNDPAVKAGRLRVELHPWYGPKGLYVNTRPAGAAVTTRGR
jgi:uncharacterized protein YciI